MIISYIDGNPVTVREKVNVNTAVLLLIINLKHARFELVTNNFQIISRKLNYTTGIIWYIFVTLIICFVGRA